MAYVPGMPTSVYDNLPDKKKEEVNNAVEKKSGGGSSSSTTSTTTSPTPYSPPNSTPSTPLPTTNLAQASQDISNSMNTKKHTTGIPTSVPVNVRNKAQQQVYQTEAQRIQGTLQQQQQANQTFVETISSNPSVGSTPSNIIEETTTAHIVTPNKFAATSDTTFQQFIDRQEFDAEKAYEKLPTAARQKILEQKQYLTTDERNAGTYKLSKEVYKLVQDNQAEYQQRTLKEMEASQFWEADQHQYVTYATAADWYTMQKNGYDTVYIEDGSGPLKNKGGVYTIGRDKLSGVPDDVRTVIVDTQGNWRYIADTGSKASYIEEMRTCQYANTLKYEDKLSKARLNEDLTQYQYEQSLLKAQELAEKYNKTRKQSDLDAYNIELQRCITFNQRHEDAVNHTNTVVTAWAINQNAYDKAINSTVKYTVEDEARYQTLKAMFEREDTLSVNNNIRNSVHDSSVANMLASDTDALSEYMDLSKRRKEAEGTGVVLSTDAKIHMDEQADAMQKAVEDYNLWDSVTVHAENGEALGDQMKRFFLRDMLGVDDNDTADLGSPTDNYMATKQDVADANSNNFWKDLKGIASTALKTFSPLTAAKKSVNRAQNAYEDAEKQIAELNKKAKTGEISKEDAAKQIEQLRMKQAAYTRSQGDAFKQAGSIIFSNVMNHLSVFDILSVQSTFVAWRMAKHPERYSNDPKFKKMQDAFKAIYGTDYRGAMDAGKMAMAMIDIKAGTAHNGKVLDDDYIYLDGSDLRHGNLWEWLTPVTKNTELKETLQHSSLWDLGNPFGLEGKKYGFWSSLGVGITTDIGAVVGLAKTGVEAFTKVGGAKLLAKSATESVTQSLTRAGFTQEAAEGLAKSLKFQSALRKDIYGAVKQSVRENVDDLGSTVVKQVQDRAELLKKAFTDDITKGFQEARYTAFTNDLARTLNNSNIIQTSLNINKSAVVSKTLRSLDDALDSAQRALFKFTCPVAGAVSIIAKTNKEIKALKNLKMADMEHLEKLFRSGEDVKASIAKLSFNSCLDGTMFRKQQEEIMDQFNWAAMSDLKHRAVYGKRYKEVIQNFSTYKDNVMRGVADSYVSHVVDTLKTTISGTHGLDDLEKLAAEQGFATFDDMFATIKTNLEDMYRFSPESKGIVNAFDAVYDTKVTQKKLGEIKTYVENTRNHSKGIAALLNSDGVSILSPLNAKMHPDFVRGSAKNASNAIHDFMYSMNNDFVRYSDRVGNPVSIHEIGLHAMNTLEDIAVHGIMDDEALARANSAVRDYLDELNNTYVKNIEDWYSNTLQDVLGVQNYLNDIVTTIPNYAGSRETLNKVEQAFMDYFKKHGADITQEELNDIIKTNANTIGKDLAQMSMEQRQSVIYRIMENKGTQMLGQISDANLEKVTNLLTDCNSQLNKNLRLLQNELDGAANQRVTDAITNACSIECTRILSSTLESGGVDSTMHMAVMDVISGHSNEINRIIQSEPTDIAVTKVQNYIIREAQTQLALHNGTYKTFRSAVGETMDVAQNAVNIEKAMHDFIRKDDKCIDVCVSMIKSTDGASPKDIAFHLRGSKEAPTVLRKQGHFSVFDDGFAGRNYGKSAQQITEEYAALGVTDTLSPDEWRNQLRDYVEKLKQQALEENKTIRFIGFNSSDAVTGNNKYLSDVLRSCGVNANMAKSVDLADFMRADVGEYVFDSAHIASLNRGLYAAIENAKSRSISLGISPSLAYDPKYNCADIIADTFGKHEFADKEISESAQYIVDSMKSINEDLGTKAYNEIGEAMGAYLDYTAFERKLMDLGIADEVSAKSDLMRILSEATAKGEPQLGLNKIIDTTLDNQWLDFSKIDGEGLKLFNNSEKVHETVLQLNSMFNNIHRTDLITEADRGGLMYIYKETIQAMPYNTHAKYMAQLIKAEELTTQQLYVVNKWMLDNLYSFNPDRFDKLYGRVLINSPKQASYLSDVGYTFVRTNIVDYTEDSMDAFFVKWLDDSNESFQFAQDLEQIRLIKQDEQNLQNYMDAVNGLFDKYNIHGVQDRMIVMQMAEIHAPIKEFRDQMKAAYNHAYHKARKALAQEAKHYGKRAKYHVDMVNREATRQGVNAAKRFIQERSDGFRRASISAVANLNAESFKTHLIRNCCGGMIIDPSAKVVQGLDLVTLFKKWESYGVKIEMFEFSNNVIQNRKLFRISLPDLNGANMDEVFAKYDHARIDFVNVQAAPFDRGMRHASFGASDGTLMNEEHMDAFKELFFKDSDATLLNLSENFNSWRNELYSCNMWADADLKQLVNPYYNDNLLNNLAQNTHQLRNNIEAVHDMTTVMNNRYMNTEYILAESGVYKRAVSISQQRKAIVDQVKAQNQKLCVISLDKNNRLQLIDYTSRLAKSGTSDEFFEKIIKNTVLLDEGMYVQLADHVKATNIALKMQLVNAPEWLSNAYGIYKKTIRAATICMYLYGNIGTAVRNYVDSSTKGLFETLQYDESVISYIKKYVSAISDVHAYSNTYRQIEETMGRVTRENVIKFFEGNEEEIRKFNIFYGYEHTCGGDDLMLELSRNEARAETRKFFMEGTSIDEATADNIRKTIDHVYASPKYYGLTTAQLEKHKVAIRDACLSKITKHNKISKEDLEIINKRFFDYSPTVETWGDKLCKFPILGFNRNRFNNAETRARLAVYRTFLESGASEYEAMKHVTSTQFHYAGIGKVEDFMPFTQYKLYNALYWFDHANMHAASTAWRAAQYNGDGSLTNKEISSMITKYRQKEYLLYDKGVDQAYDQFYDRTLSVAEHILLDGVDSYLGVARESGLGNLDLNGTHYLKLGNSFVDELSMVLSCAVGAYAFGATIGHVGTAEGVGDKIRLAYESLKYTPLYDSFYSPWKSYFDLTAYAYDKRKIAGKQDKPLTSSDIWGTYYDFMANKSTHDEAIAMLPVLGAVLSNIVSRKKSFELNKGQLMALWADPDVKNHMYNFARDTICDITGMLIPSLVGTRVDPDYRYPYTYSTTMLNKMLVDNPETYFDILGRLQRDMGFTPEEAEEIWKSIRTEWDYKDTTTHTTGIPTDVPVNIRDAAQLQLYQNAHRSKLDYYHIAAELFSKGYTTEEITNLFKQHGLPSMDNERFLAMTQALPGYLRYDKNMRSEIIAYYKSLGMSTDAAWAKLMLTPAVIKNGKIVEITHGEAIRLSERQSKAYYAINNDNLTDEEWKAYWDNMPYRYPKGKWSETYQYLRSAGYTPQEARAELLHGIMLDANGKLVDVQGQVRTQVFSYSTLKGAEWDAYWNTVPDYTKYEKGAFGRTMKALKGMGYDDATARALIQQGIYVGKDGVMLNVTGMERPVLGYPSFNAYYQTIPDYIKYEKGAFKRTYAALKELGFDYDTSLRLIQQGAYLMDVSAAPDLVMSLQAQAAQNKINTKDLVVTDVNTLLQKHGSTVITGADGKPYVLTNCSGLQRPRKSFGYSRRSYSRGRGGRGRGGYGGGGHKRVRRSRNYIPKFKKPKPYYMRSPYVLSNNVSSYGGFTGFRGKAPGKPTKPYTTKGYVSTYSMQNFLNGASYGMRKAYKIDMRQYKSGALSIKSAYPASYRNIAVAYRRNLYKDMYAKYGASRMQMRANQAGYSNASIVRLRRNEIYNRERYAERRDRKVDEKKVRTRATR